MAAHVDRIWNGFRFAMLASLFVAGPAQAAYTILDLGTLGGIYASSQAFGLSASGQVVGQVLAPDGTDIHAFRTNVGTTINVASDLGTLGGSSSYAEAINSSGQAVGNAYTTGGAAFHAFRTTATGTINTPADLGTLGGTNSDAAGCRTP